MCGIAGVIGRVGDLHGTLVRALSLMNESRGRDSYGYLTKKVRNKKDSECDWFYEKSTCSAQGFLASKRDEVGMFTDSIATMVHCRGASAVLGIGSSSFSANAHPFVFDTVSGAHNGCIRNWREIKTKYDIKRADGTDIEVDSEVIFWMIQNHGVASLSELEGPAATWWWNNEASGSIWIRNWEKELAIHQSKGLVVFSSESRHLEALGLKCKAIPSDGTMMSININTKEVKEEGKIAGKTIVYSYTPTGSGYFSSSKRLHWCIPFKYDGRDGWLVYDNVGRFSRVAVGVKLPRDFGDVDHRGSGRKKIDELQEKFNSHTADEDDRIDADCKLMFDGRLLGPGKKEDTAATGTMLNEADSVELTDLVELVLDGNEVSFCPVCKMWHNDNEAEIWPQSTQTEHTTNLICPTCNQTMLVRDNVLLNLYIEEAWITARPLDRRRIIDLYGCKSDKDVLENVELMLFPALSEAVESATVEKAVASVDFSSGADVDDDGTSYYQGQEMTDEQITAWQGGI